MIKNREGLPEFPGRAESIEFVKCILMGAPTFPEKFYNVTDGKEHSESGASYRYLEVACEKYHLIYKVWGEKFHLLKIHLSHHWNMEEITTDEVVAFLFKDFGGMIDFIICLFCEEDADAVDFYMNENGVIGTTGEMWEYNKCDWFESPVELKEEKSVESIIYTDNIDEMIEIVNIFRGSYGVSVTACKSAGTWEIKFA
jgi:hypothetical protein